MGSDGKQRARERYAKNQQAEWGPDQRFQCAGCSHVGPRGEFSKVRQNGGGLCRECNKRRCLEYNAKRPKTSELKTKAAAAARAYHQRQRAAVVEEKLRRGVCVDCNLIVTAENLAAFDFDHRDPLKKIQGIGIMVRTKQSAEELIAEMAKCDLRCANCHRLKTTREGEWGRRPTGKTLLGSMDYHIARRALIGDEKLRRKSCLDCGLGVTLENLVVFDFGYRNPAERPGGGMANQTAGRLPAEMAKCDLRCVNCHRLARRYAERDERAVYA